VAHNFALPFTCTTATLSLMHIIAGTHRSRRLLPLPNQAIRPTAARAREALFNILMHRFRDDGSSLVQGARIADICCGSGAIGLEALSRGAAHVTFVDSATQSLSIAKRNAESLKEVGKCTFLSSDVTRLPSANAAYDIIFTDPPYDATFLPALFERLVQGGWMHTETLLITEQRNGAEAVVHPSLTLTESRKYGQSVIRFYMIAS
jgi:16S rRNA (guanine966-N2)-methyltransferase